MVDQTTLENKVKQNIGMAVDGCCFMESADNTIMKVCIAGSVYVCVCVCVRACVCVCVWGGAPS